MSGRQRIVYPAVEAIFARKKNGQLYRHDFETAAPLIGEPDGSLRIPGRPKKWAVIDGEPWMVNGPVVKPRRRKAGRRRKGRAKRNHALAVYALANRPEGNKDMARRRNRKGRFTKTSSRATSPRRRRRSPRAVYLRSTARRINPRRRARRRSYRRNPPVMGGFLGRLVPPLGPIVTSVAGATATRLVANQAEAYFPSLVVSAGPQGAPVENKMGRLAIKIASALLVGFAGGMVLGKARGSQLAAGGLVIVTDELVRSEVLPRIGLSEYVEPYEVVGEFITSGGGDSGEVPGQAMLSDGGYDDDDLSAFMDDGMGDFVPGRLSPASRLS